MRIFLGLAIVAILVFFVVKTDKSVDGKTLIRRWMRNFTIDKREKSQNIQIHELASKTGRQYTGAMEKSKDAIDLSKTQAANTGLDTQDVYSRSHTITDNAKQEQERLRQQEKDRNENP